MRWQVKALAQQVFSHVPGGASLNELAQQHLTGGLQVTPGLVDRTCAAGERHWEAISRGLADRSETELIGYEFGAGWHLGVAILLSAKGVGRQTVVDRLPLARPDLVMAMISALGAGDLGVPGRRQAEPCDDVDRALSALRIEYLAPCDARATGLPSESVDFVTSTSTLEHIPEDELGPLLTECHRLLRPGGLLSAQIDYGDHYAHVDPTISSVNFLVYGPLHWRLYSPPLHFQNRLRHSDHLAKLAAAGFEILSAELTPGDERDKALVCSGRLHGTYQGRDVEDLTTREAHIVARKR